MHLCHNDQDNEIKNQLLLFLLTNFDFLAKSKRFYWLKKIPRFINLFSLIILSFTLIVKFLVLNKTIYKIRKEKLKYHQIYTVIFTKSSTLLIDKGNVNFFMKKSSSEKKRVSDLNEMAFLYYQEIILQVYQFLEDLLYQIQ